MERTQRIYLPDADEVDPPSSPASANLLDYSADHIMETSYDNPEVMDYNVIYNSSGPDTGHHHHEDMDDGLLVQEDLLSQWWWRLDIENEVWVQTSSLFTQDI